MIKLGTQKIKGIYLSGGKVERAYLGETVVFTADKPARLPDGYTEVEYIDFDGNARINVGISKSWPRYKTVVTLELLPNSAPGCFFGTSEFQRVKVTGVGQKTYVSQQALEYDGSNVNITSSYSQYGGDPAVSASIPAAAGKMTVLCDNDNNIFAVNGKNAEFSAQYGGYALPTVQLGCRSYKSKSHFDYATTTTSYVEMMAFRFYEFISYNANGEIFSHIVPCIRKSDGKTGVFLLHTESFVGVADGSIVAGPEI